MSDVYFLIAGIILMLLFVAFFSGIEIAFINANRLGIELKKKQGKLSGIIMSRFMEQPSRFVGICLIGLNIFMVLYGLLFSELMRSFIWDPSKISSPYLKLALNTVSSTIVVLLFGEFLPKAIFRVKSDSLLSFFAPLSSIFYQLLTPIATLFVNFSESILKYLFNVRIKTSEEYFSMVDLEHFLQQTNEQDESNPDLNRELLQNALSLPSIKIRQCLVPRTEIEAVELKMPMTEVRKRFEETKLSKLIVFEGNIDNIVGYAHQLDLFKKPVSLNSILLPISVIPESMNATDLINKFSKEHKTIAWVVDEFGGTAGIITMEDLLEEIFGDIQDEYDTEEFIEKQLADNEFIFSGRLELDYIAEKYNLEFPEHGSETLSGYIITEHETIPRPKERIILNKYEFDIINVSDTRIEMVKLKVLL
ncbi:MAG TPA: hemolysin family protein [Panacibacter sp.]|nr:hemolysin family protein [Panacibacter sp.]HNP46889.1 hemolysin family protein [Panacibacter sp.]